MDKTIVTITIKRAWCVMPYIYCVQLFSEPPVNPTGCVG
jgi:hypothetical protein